MLLCDVGNTSFHFLEVNTNTSKELNYKKSVDSFSPQEIEEEIYYICVNHDVKKVLDTLDNWIDVSEHINMTPYYETMGIDRIVACEAVQNAVIVDAGSAITVDVVKDGVFNGGFIYPGTKAMSDTYTNISSALKYDFNYELDLITLPTNSRDAISYAYLKLLYTEVTSYNINIVLTGGDAKKLSSIFPKARVDEKLIFKGIQKLINYKR